MKKVYLGIYGYDAKNPMRGHRHNGGAVLLRRGAIAYAIEEERLSRIKNDASYPIQAIDTVLQYSTADEAVIAGWPRHRFMGDAQRYYMQMAKHSNGSMQRMHYYKKGLDFFIHALGAAWMRLPNLPKKHAHYKTHCIRHHDAHAASAYYTSPWGNDDVLVITLDGSGDAHCGGIWLGSKGKLHQKHLISAVHSVGNIYSSWTGHLGFTPNRHEGKVLGLAAYGNPKILGDKLLAMVDFTADGHPHFNATLMQLAYARFSAPLLETLAEDLSREDIAAGLQYFTEQVVAHLVRHWVHTTGVKKIALAGGVFANVKLNQRLLELSDVENIYIHPNMGDGGLAAGAALAQNARDHDGATPVFMQHTYLGLDITSTEARQACDDAGLIYQKPDDLANEAATILATGKVVARAAGRMEYGPRALGNRTLFASCSDPSINTWLNKKLKRTEFMPFAPIIMEEYAAEYFSGWKKEHAAARFMTLTYNATAIAKKHIPAAIHVDGTARPQVLRKVDNPAVHAILQAYHAKTGVPALINTSFNIHEEPIVCSAKDAIRAYQVGAIDALICADLIITD